MPSRTLSLRNKLLVLLSAVIFDLLLLLFTTNYFSYQIKQLQQAKSTIQQIGITALQLRRNEKDFGCISKIGSPNGGSFFANQCVNSI